MNPGPGRQEQADDDGHVICGPEGRRPACNELAEHARTNEVVLLTDLHPRSTGRTCREPRTVCGRDDRQQLAQVRLGWRPRCIVGHRCEGGVEQPQLHGGILAVII